MTNKLTQKQGFEKLLELGLPSELEQFVKERLAAVEKRGQKKPTKTQAENEVFKEALVKAMGEEPGKLFTVAEAQGLVPELAEATNQKMTQLLTQLVKAGRVDRVVEKNKAHFTVSPEAVEEEVAE